MDASDIYKRAHAIGTYYGFTPLSSALLASRGKPKPQAVSVPEGEHIDAHAKEFAQLLKRIHASGNTPSPTRPLFIWHSNVTPGRKPPRTLVMQFHALGADRAIVDAVLIRAVHAFVSDISKQPLVLKVNSMGDKETRARLTREMGNFFRKRAATLPEECIISARTDVFSAAELLLKTELSEGLPSPTDHLSENSRKHFEAVLEYLESTDTPYELAPHLLSRSPVWNETCFEIVGDEKVHAWGSRYFELAKPFFKSSPASAGAIVRINLEKVSSTVIPPHKTRKSPLFVFVHIGDEAKRESMKLADLLRRARLPLTQAIGIESLTEQMRFAEEQNPRFLIIMGRKEALEHSVILRERANHTETIVPLHTLVETLKTVS